MACVVFALFGAPLAIITIGDLGKFLSECTIWLYKRMIDGRRRFDNWWHRLRLRGKGALDAEAGINREPADKSNVDWGEIDRTEVPVSLVFTILLVCEGCLWLVQQTYSVIYCIWRSSILLHRVLDLYGLLLLLLRVTHYNRIRRFGARAT